MDIITELGKSALTIAALLAVLIAIPILFMYIFSIATGIDQRLDR